MSSGCVQYREPESRCRACASTAEGVRSPDEQCAPAGRGGTGVRRYGPLAAAQWAAGHRHRLVGSKSGQGMVPVACCCAGGRMGVVGLGYGVS